MPNDFKAGHIDRAMQAHTGLIEHLIKQRDFLIAPLLCIVTKVKAAKI